MTDPRLTTLNHAVRIQVTLNHAVRIQALEERLQALETRLTSGNIYRCTDGALEPWDVEASSPQQAAEIFAGSFSVREYPNQVIVTDEAGKKHHYLINRRYSATLVAKMDPDHAEALGERFVRGGGDW